MPLHLDLGKLPTGCVVRLHMDFETFSEVDLKATGVDKYAADVSTGIWCMSYKFIAYDEEEPDVVVKAGDTKIWVTFKPYECDRHEFPDSVLMHIRDGGEVVAHNAAFEYAIWNKVVPRYYLTKDQRYHHYAPLKPAQMNCTMARAMALGYPASLEQCASFLELPIQKDQKGRRIMMQLARPRKYDDDGDPVWWSIYDCTDKEKPDIYEKHIALQEYCMTDTDVEVGIDHEIDELPKKERMIWRMDRVINDRGVFVDQSSVRNSLMLVDAYTKRRLERLEQITDFAVRAITDLTGLRLWMSETHGIKVPSLDKAAVVELLKRDDLPGPVREALEIRQELGRSSLAKLKAMLNSSDSDGRSRGLFQYHGATTGRWAGRRIQTQNMVRPKLKQDQIELAFEMLLSHDDPGTSLSDQFDLPLTEIISYMMRGMLRSENDTDTILIGADLNQIEARVLPWLAGDKRKLDLFRKGVDIYRHTAADMFQIDNVDDVTDQQRFLGKIGELALGYGGGPAAFMKMAKAYGVDISPDYAEEIKQRWRGVNKLICRFWRDLERAFRSAVVNPGSTYSVGKIKFRMKDRDLRMVLPSGRELNYPRARIVGGELQFYGQNTYTRQWGFQKTYGGMLAENATQAVARDVQSDAMLRLEINHCPIVLHTHDEIVVEVSIGSSQDSVAFVVEKMTKNAPWNKGLPIAAEAWRGERYRK